MKNKNNPGIINNSEIIKFLKNNVRERVQRERNNLPVNYREKSSRAIAKKFLNCSFYTVSNNILIYYPFRNEVETTLIIEDALKDNKNIILPRVHNKELELYYVTNLKEQLKAGAYGIMEPVASRCKPAKISDVDLVVVPGVSFDKKFYRLGYGGGYYDRILSRIPKKVKKIALCFDIQVVDSLPVSAHDIKVDMIITESKIYRSS
ncbi:MAG: 5-formyltetrahydrofolate cyclo-ligase [Actinomycetota bacterium]|nr:5-formyltetrahydrofolate cyclo-ligase [Actinomycetota bacterium]